MKIVAKPIEMICWFDKKGIHPLKFKIHDTDDSSKVIKIDKILFQEQERLAGNKMWVFDCQSIINGAEIRYQIKYELETCKWILFKI